MTRFLRTLPLMLAALSCLALPAAAQTTASAPAVSFSATTVGTAETGTVLFTFSAATTVASVQVVTQGTTGLDFQRSTAGGTCTATPYAASGFCTVNVTFNPLAPGTRLGAALLLDASNNKVGVGLLSGSGNGPLLTTGLASTSTPYSSIATAVLALTTDAAGNVYVGSSSNGAGHPPIVEFTGASTQLPFTPAAYPSASGDNIGGIAVDGAGYIYAGDRVNGDIYKVDPVTGASSVLAALPSGVSDLVIGARNILYVSTFNNGAYTVTTPSGTIAALPGSTTAGLYNIAVDGAGSVYYTDSSNNLYKNAAGTVTTLLTVSSQVNALTADAAGNLFYTATGTTYEINAGTTYRTTLTSGGSASFVDAFGNLYNAAASQYNFNVFARNKALLNTAVSTTTAVGAKSATTPLAVENDGNVAATISSITGTGAANATGYTCATSTPIAAAGVCSLGVQFAPTAHGSPQSNSLVVAGNFTAPTITITGYVTGDPYQLAFTTPPATPIPSGQNAGTVKVAVEDYAAGPSTNPSSVTLTVTGPASYFAQYTAPTDGTGTATFNLATPALVITGPYTYTASGTVTTGGATLVPAVASETVYPYQLAFTTPPTASIPAGGNAGTTVTVAIETTGGTVATTQTGPITLTVTGPSSYSQTYGPITPTNGSAVFNLSSTPLTAAGPYTYTATGTGIPVSTTYTSGIAAETVTPLPASSFTIVPTAGPAYPGFAKTLTVTPVDLYGNLATTYNGTVTITTTDTTASSPAPFAVAGAATNTAVTFNTLSTSGFTVTATDASTPAPLQGTSAAIVVSSVPLFTVTSNLDDGAGVCTNQFAANATIDAKCELRAAIAAVNTLSFVGAANPVPVINFDPALYGQTITLTSVLSITANINLTGPAPLSTVTISGGNATRILQSTISGTVNTISGLTLTQGLSSTGLPGSSFLAGGVWFSTSTTPITINFINDRITASGFSGATTTNVYGPVYINNGNVTLSGCTFSQNSNSLTSNTSVLGGAYSQLGGALSVTNSTQMNTVFSQNSVSVPSTTSASGGAMYLANNIKPLLIDGATFTGNSISTPTGQAYGGAVYLVNTTVSYTDVLANSLFNGNSASSNAATGGGALYLQSGTIAITGSTFTGNTLLSPATPISNHLGGAIYSNGGQFFLYNDTITRNSAGSTNGKSNGGGIYSTVSNRPVYNTVIAGNSSFTYPDGSSLINNNQASYVNNLSVTSCINNCTPKLSALGNYGGRTQTIVPLIGSPLLGTGSVTYVAPMLAGGATSDARGFPRTVNSQVDIGAVETNPATAIWLGNSNQTLSTFSTTGVASSTPSGGGLGTIATPLATAFDSSNNVWVASSAGITEFNSAGAPVLQAPITSAGINAPVSVAVDGAGQVWIANADGTISLLPNSNPVPIPTVSFPATTGTPGAVAIDLSGNVWITGQSAGTITELLGAAFPVASLATALTAATTANLP